MPLFVCDECECVDNTALTQYWSTAEDAPALCSECDPDIGKWHDQFPKEKYDPKTDVGSGKPLNR